jgi:hypothetical protein
MFWYMLPTAADSAAEPSFVPPGRPVPVPRKYIKLNQDGRRDKDDAPEAR